MGLGGGYTARAMHHYVAKNGATLVAYGSPSASGPRRLIVAGQHGNETGPIEALAGFRPRADGRTVIVCVANPLGYATNSRYCVSDLWCPTRDVWRPDREIDLNRGWGESANPVCLEMWDAAVELLGGVPHVVADLHSTPRTDELARLTLPADERATRLASDIASSMSDYEPGWAVRDGVAYEGCLHTYAASQGAVSVAAEFFESPDRAVRQLGVLGAVRVILDYATK